MISKYMNANSNPVIGVLALQGCVYPHKFHLEALGASFKELRNEQDLINVDGIILPGGESTTMLKLIKEFNLEATLKETFGRVPVWGICAGAILMAKTVTSPQQPSFALLDIEIERNAYGSQIQSFNETIENSYVSFIRAPIIKHTGAQVITKSWHKNAPVWVQQGNYMATTFHPELVNQTPSNIHKYFVQLVKNTR